MDYLDYIEYFRRFSGPFLAGKTAIVNGADHPIGLAVARKLSAAGARVALGYHRNPELVENAALPDGHISVRCDAADAAQADALVTAALDAFGGVDILINNPTFEDTARIEDITDGQVKAVLDDAVLAVIHLCRRVAPLMRAQKSGRIVNMGHFVAKSGSARRGAHFSAARAGILGITKELTSELFGDGITVNAVAPGSIAGCTAPGGDVNPLHLPMGREGTPDEAAAPVLFLCSEHANFITGVCVDVNGGAYMD